MRIGGLVQAKIGLTQAYIAIRRLGLTKRLLVSWSSGMMNGKNRFSGLQQFVVWFGFGGD